MSSKTRKAVSDHKSVTLYVPGLRLHDASEMRRLTGQQQSLDAMELLFSRADFQRGNLVSPEAVLFDLFNMGQEDSSELPVGALTRYLVKGNYSGDQWVMRADPVLLQPNRDHLVLLGNSGLDIRFEDAEQIVNDINQTYSDTSWRLNVITPKQWVLEQGQPEELKTQSLSSVVGKNINDCLPKGVNEKKWHALLNELQMFLHAHPVNQQRQMQGMPMINSLWFWGAGILPVTPDDDGEKPLAQCWSDETVSLALARLLKIPRTDLPANAETWLTQSITPGNHLLVIELLNSESVKTDPLMWWQSLIQFNEQWLSTMVSAVKQKNIDQLRVLDSDGSCYHLTRSLAKRWWALSLRK